MKHIGNRDIKFIVKIILDWPSLSKKFSWEDIRGEMACKKKVDIKKVWSRQSLCKNEEIRLAYNQVRVRLLREKNLGVVAELTKDQKTIRKLRKDILTAKTKYSALLERHQTLIYNLSISKKYQEKYLSNAVPENTISQE